MRLTLRHLLAYMDDLVDPTLEAQEIKKLVAESDFAQQLIERIRAAAQRGDLPAPQPQGPQNKHDPNRTAEYLDRVLPSESVEEVEKLCLNSDVLLAELGDCHHILKLVLGGPPHFEASSRDRMYLAIEHAQKFEPSKTPPAFERPQNIDGQPLSSGSRIGTALPPAVVEAAEKAAAAALGVKDKPDLVEVAPPPVDPSAEPRERPEVPDYLRDETPAWQKYAPVIAVIALLAVGVAFWQVNQRRQTALQTGTPNTTVQASATPAVSATAVTTPAATPLASPAVGGTVEATVAPTTMPAVPQTSVVIPELPTVPAPTVAPAVPAPTVPPAVPLIPAVPVPAPTGTPAPMPTAVPLIPAVPVGTPAPVPMGTPEPTTLLPVPMPEVPPVPPVPRMQVGDYTSNESILFNLQKGEGGLIWKRLPPRALIYSGDHLAVMPAFRVTLELADSLQVEMLGGSLVEVLPLEGGVPGLRVIAGRIVFNCDAPNTKVRLQVQGKLWTITLADAEAEVAIEINPLKAEGLDPETVTAPGFEGLFFVSSGQVILQYENISFQPAMPPARGFLVGLKEVGSDQPAWINMSDVPLIDQKAAVYFEKGITTDQSAAFRLKELEQDRRAEVRLLALRGLSLLGEYEPLVRALSEEDLRPATRDELIVHLRTAVATSPEAARAVRATFEKVAGATDGYEQYKMLWGYSADSLARGDGVRLVNRLEDEKFAFRALAFWNLRTASNGLTLLYRPEAKKEQRDGPVKRWRERLDMGLFKAAP